MRHVVATVCKVRHELMEMQLSQGKTKYYYYREPSTADL